MDEEQTQPGVVAGAAVAEDTDGSDKEESEDEMEEEPVVPEGTAAKKTKNSDLMMMMKQMMMKNDAHQKSQKTFTKKVDKSLQELTAGLKTVQTDVVDLTKEVKENKAELDQLRADFVAKDGNRSEGGWSTVAASSRGEDFVPGLIEVRNWCDPSTTREHGVVLSEVQKFFKEAFAVPAEGLTADTGRILCNGIRMKFKKCYCVTVVIEKDLRPKAELIATHLNDYAADHRFKDRQLFIALELDPVEEARKTMFLALRAFIRRHVLANNGDAAKLAAKWAPQWIVTYDHRVVGGIRPNGGIYITKQLSVLAGAELSELNDEMALMVG